MMSRACLIIATIVAMGCGSGTKPNTPGTGGSGGVATLSLPGTGGSVGAGGSIVVGGSFVTGGIASTGGIVVSGGATSGGGSTAVVSTGGVVGSGGASTSSLPGTGGTTVVSTVDASADTGVSVGTIDAGGIDGTVDVPNTGGIIGNGGSVGTGGGGGNATGGTSTTGAGGTTGGTISMGGTSAAGGTTSVESTGLDGTWTWVSLACSGTDVPFAPDTTLTTFQISGNTGELTIIRSACPVAGGGGTESGNMTFSYPSAGHVTISSPLPITCVPANCSADCDGSRTFGLTGTYTYTIQGNQATLTDQQTSDICPSGYLYMVWQKQGSGGTGGSTGSGGTGGSTGSGGITGTGGTTSPNTGLACPLGTWTPPSPGIICGTTNASEVLVVTETVAGQYSVTLTAGPLNHQGSCQMMTWGSLSATYTNGVLIFTLNPDSDTCAQKLGTMTMTINADCTQGTMKTTTVGCLNCGATGANGGNGCSGCGSMTCPPTGPDIIAVRSP
jgi:hypothetical protein